MALVELDGLGADIFFDLEQGGTGVDTVIFFGFAVVVLEEHVQDRVSGLEFLSFGTVGVEN